MQNVIGHRQTSSLRHQLARLPLAWHLLPNSPGLERGHGIPPPPPTALSILLALRRRGSPPFSGCGWPSLSLSVVVPASVLPFQSPLLGPPTRSKKLSAGVWASNCWCHLVCLAGIRHPAQFAAGTTRPPGRRMPLPLAPVLAAASPWTHSVLAAALIGLAAVSPAVPFASALGSLLRSHLCLPRWPRSVVVRPAGGRQGASASTRLASLSAQPLPAVTELPCWGQAARRLALGRC